MNLTNLFGLKSQAVCLWLLICGAVWKQKTIRCHWETDSVFIESLLTKWLALLIYNNDKFKVMWSVSVTTKVSHQYFTSDSHFSPCAAAQSSSWICPKESMCPRHTAQFLLLDSSDLKAHSSVFWHLLILHIFSLFTSYFCTFFLTNNLILSSNFLLNCNNDYNEICELYAILQAFLAVLLKDVVDNKGPFLFGRLHVQHKKDATHVKLTLIWCHSVNRYTRYVVVSKLGICTYTP